MFDLTDNIAMVTGGANGIGKGIAETLTKAGAKVMICDIDEEAGEKTAEVIDGEFFRLDVTDPGNAERVVEEILEKYDKIDILAANTGIYPEVMIEDMTEEDWDKIQNINLKGLFFTAKPVLKAMKEQNYGRLILTSSITGDITGYPGGSIYGATKAGILGYMRNAAMEYAKYGVTVNAVQPGMVGTETLKKELGVLYDKGAESVPLKRLGKPEDIGAAVAFFASKEAGYITAQSLVVDGGQIVPETPDVLD
ncbi:SDR family NAD(P)-dependent oxidoreductase [Salinicoccus halitifaciens]|uniref:3-oxoacyl-[acyl-carrier-protein] reductase FabG n=1 Tax=Salinicoccus halitifaciens TaxID=1073415 RepID=A0ABV2E9S4_9STAP|nr:SDR family oxidoreductase [Salinicoccus halitifaciens]MCD2138034.1 SDR family oxidoreductase [Salinicoccus halitifaciens]